MICHTWGGGGGGGGVTWWYMSIFKQGSISENRTIHISMMKNWVSHILFLKGGGGGGGAYRIPGSVEKGTIQHAHLYSVIYR